MEKSVLEKRLSSHEGKFLHVYARNCEVRRILKPLALEFLSEYHGLGSTTCRYAYGLFVAKAGKKGARKEPLPEGTLVAVSTFSGARNIPVEALGGTKFIKSYEWVRYASLPDVRVIGGMGKTLKHFIAEVHPDDVMSYAMVEPWKEDALARGVAGVQSTGDAYLRLGFEKEGVKTFPGGESLKFRLRLTY